MTLPTGIADERENQRTINATANIVANFRIECPNVTLADWPCSSVLTLIDSRSRDCSLTH